jgi:hypothetical protein
VAGPRLSVEPERLQFGTLDRGERATRTLRLENTGDAELTVEDIRPSCAECMVGDLQARRLAPGERFELEVTFVAVDVPGDHTAHLTLTTNDEGERLRRVYLDVTIEAVETPRLAVEPRGIDLGVVMAAREVETAIELHNVGGAPLTISGSTTGPDLQVVGELPAELAPDARASVKLRIGPPAPGVLRSHLSLATNQPQQRVVTVSLTGYAARREQVEDLLGGLHVRLTGDGAVEAVNRADGVAWMGASGAIRLIPPGQRLRLPVAPAATGERIRLIVELPLPDEPVERRDR